MMNINRENYEVWFIDFIDGKLSNEARMELNAFLQANPDLKEELNTFEELNLEPSAISCDLAERLYKKESDLMEISRPDYLLVKQMEEGLSDEEEKELAAMIREDESFIRRGVEFQHSRLTSGTISYEGKFTLLQKRILPLWLNPGRIAAAVAAAVLLLALWNSSLLFTPEQDELVLEPMPSRPAVVISPEIPKTILAKIDPINELLNSSPDQSVYNDRSNEVLVKDEFILDMIPPEEPMEKLQPNFVQLTTAGRLPNAYEAGLRHMMPMYLDINRENDRLLASVAPKSARPVEETFIVKGLQFMDRVSGDLLNFDKLYDEEGNFVAYNFKAGSFEVERKLRR